MADTSNSLLERLSEDPGDPDSWARLVKIYMPFLKRWIAYFGVHENDAADVAQEAFLRIRKKIGDFRHNSRPGAFRRWLREIVRLCVLEQRRKSPPNCELPKDIDDLQDDHSALSRDIDMEHDEHVVRKLLESARNHFSDRDVDIFEAVMLQERSVPEVARQFPVTPDLVYTVIYNIKKCG